MNCLRRCQKIPSFWLATHSIGMMRRALELGQGNPGSVVFLDFDGVNFDIPATLRPSEPNRPFWKRALQIALDDLAGYVTPETVVLCEGGQLKSGSDFDAQCYNEIFEGEYPQVVFVGAGNSNDIQSDPRGVRSCWMLRARVHFPGSLIAMIGPRKRFWSCKAVMCVRRAAQLNRTSWTMTY